MEPALSRSLLAWLAPLAALLPPPSSPDGPMALKEVKTWMFQFQSIESAGAVDALSRSGYDLLVVEPTGTYRQGSRFDMKAMVDRLHAGRPGRCVLAYFSLGEADENRAYWQKSWKAPDRDHRGSPDFLLKPDPDGWKETHIVRYSDPRWQELLLTDARALLAAGFDGLYLDWIEACRDQTVVEDLKARSLDPARAMVDLVAKVRDECRKKNPEARMVLQNAEDLLEADPRILPLADAVAAEATWFGGKAEVEWADPAGGDRPHPEGPGASARPARLARLAQWKSAGKPVFTVDYCLKPANAQQVYQEATGRGFIPLVSRSALDRLTETPPPGLK